MSRGGKFISKFLSFHCFPFGIAAIFIFFITNKGLAQTVRTSPGSASVIKKDSIVLNATTMCADSLHKDSLAAADTSKRHTLERSLGIKISKDALPATVKAEAQDSAVMDMKENRFYLYGKAQVNYQDLQLNAGQVSFHQAHNVVTASPYDKKLKDPGDTTKDKQTFKQGKETFTYDSLQYNFRSKRAIVRNVHSQYGEGYMYSEQVKRNPDQTIFGYHSLYTTCALDTPHFGIVAKKIKVIPGKVIVSGPADLYIEGVPTPLFLPFGLFPVSEKQKSGFLLPTYTIEQARGLGLLNGGYYFYFNDNADLRTQANFYTKGSYAVTGVSDYVSRYHYRGALSFSYAYNKTGEDFEPNASIQKDFMVNWTHQSDAKSVPGQTFNASVQAGTSSFYSNNSYDPNQILQNQYQSNVSYAKSWQGTPFGLTLSALHSQNTQTRQINVTLPSLNFHVTQINPFQKKTRVGTRWYDKITASYNMDALNRTTFYDSVFSFSKLSTSDFHAGIHHSVPVSASYTVLRYINMSFSANYNEYWLTERLYQHYSNAEQRLDSVRTNGFYTARDFNAGISFSTRIYGMKMFKKGSLRGIRHVITPTVGFTYYPDFGASPFNYYYRTHLDSSSTYSYLSPYVTSVIGMPPLGKAGAISLGVNNNLQVKVRSARDTISGFRNVTLIDGLNFSTSYNPAVDSFQWSSLRIDFRTNVLDKINITSSAAYDPYSFDYVNGRRLPTLMIDNATGIARFTNATIAVGTNFHSRPKGGANNPTNSEEYARIMRNAGYNDYVDFNIPWSFNCNYSLSANSTYSRYSHKDTIVTSQTLTFQGELQLTTRWKLTLSSGYNFDYHELTLTSIDVYRDLHCWAMHFQTVPFGPRKSYSFTINVKSAILQDLKLMRRRDYRDSPY